MILFRTDTYQFPHIEAILERKDGEDRGLTLRFFGAARPAIAHYFKLVDITKKTKIKEGKFFGSLANEVKIEVKLVFKDKSGIELDDEKSTYSRIGEQKSTFKKSARKKKDADNGVNKNSMTMFSYTS